MSSIRGIVVVAAVAVVALLSLAPASAQYAPGGGIVCDTSVVLPGGAFTCSAGGFLPGSAVAVTATGSTTGLVGRSTTAAGQWTHESTTTADGARDAVGVVEVPDDTTGPTSVVRSGTGLDDGPRVLTNASAVTVAAAGDPLVEPAVDADHADPANATDAVAAQLRDAGIKVKRTILPGSTFWNDWVKYPFSSTNWNARPLGVQIWALAYRSGEAWNEFGYANPEFDALLSEALATFRAVGLEDTARRAALQSLLLTAEG